jgi:DnaJ-class molecular chaperone
MGDPKLTLAPRSIVAVVPDTDSLMVEVFVRCEACGGTGNTPLPRPQVRLTVAGVDVKGTCSSCQGEGGERRRVSLADFKRLLSEA